MYQKAWRLLLERIEGQTGWGKEQLRKLMFKCLMDVTEEETNQTIAYAEEVGCCISGDCARCVEARRARGEPATPFDDIGHG